MTNETENPLEAALRLAAAEPAHRPEFYRLLLDSTVYILSPFAGQQSGERTFQTGEEIAIQHWTREDGSPVIPFFTSLAILERSIEGESGYIALPARSLLEMTKGSTLVLNPRSDFGKEFPPAEIEALLTVGLNHVPNRRVVEKETRILLGQPARYPAKLVDSLTTLLSRHGNVRAAYVALMHDPAQDEKPHLVVGIDGDGDLEQVIREAGNVAVDAAPDGEPVDLMRVGAGKDGLSEYFRREVKPFYERHWGSRLKSFLGFGRA